MDEDRDFTGPRRVRLSRVGKTLVAVVAGLIAACSDSAPLAPSGSVVYLSANPTSVAFNGMATVSVQLSTLGGQLPEDGTVVTFSATLGEVQPAEVRIVAGRATVTFLAGSVSGNAVITATLDSQTGRSTSSISITVGSVPAVLVTVTADPPALPYTGGTTSVTAVVSDESGNPMISVPITFSTTAGTVSPSPVKTSGEGKATTALTTTARAVVTASVGADGSVSQAAGSGPSASVTIALTPRPQPTVTVTAGENPVALTPVRFTISVAPAASSGTTIQNVSVDFGDGTPRVALGPVNGTTVVQHRYQSAGTYRVTAEAVDSGGGVGSAAAVIVVGAQAPMSVVVAGAPAGPPGMTSTIFTFTATVMPATVVVANYQWNFGDGSPILTTTGPQATHSFQNSKGPYTVTVAATSVDGVRAEGFTIIAP